MGKIAIVSLGYLWFPCESGTLRFYDIANAFVARGHEVECITTGFQHFKKAPRDKDTILSQGYPFAITFIDVPPYRKNIDVRRVFSNKVAAARLKAYLVQKLGNPSTCYDAVYVAIPANNIAAMVTTLCKKYQVPVVVDVEDLWPEAMSMVVKNNTLRNVLFHSFARDARKAYERADGIVGTSEDYTERAFRNRPQNIPQETVYVGCQLADFDDGVDRYSSDIAKPEDEIWITYAGSISTSYDIKTLIDAGYSLCDQRVHVQILGTGSMKEELEEYSRNMENIHFWGFVPYPKMAAVLTKSDVVVNSFIKGAPQSIVNKTGDYLASGRPMINTLLNPVFTTLVSQYDVGTNVEPGNMEVLAGAIKLYLGEAGVALGKKQGANARMLAETRFDRKKSYQKIVDMVEGLYV